MNKVDILKRLIWDSELELEEVEVKMPLQAITDIEAYKQSKKKARILKKQRAIQITEFKQLLSEEGVLLDMIKYLEEERKYKESKK